MRPGLQNPIPWPLETAYCHHGIPLSNGVFGALLWFGRDRIHITFNRGDFWDRRGAVEWPKSASYKELVQLARNGEVDQIRRLFRGAQVGPDGAQPTRLPLGRVEIPLAPGVRPARAELDLFAGEARVLLYSASSGSGELRGTVYADFPGILLSASADLVGRPRLLPASDFEEVAGAFGERGIPAAKRIVPPDAAGAGDDGPWGGSRGVSAFTQRVPENPTIAAGLAVAKDSTGAVQIVCGAEYSEEGSGIIEMTRRRAAETARAGYFAATAATRSRWQALMERTAAVSVHDPTMERMYILGIYKMLGNSMPGGIAPSLQGPWVEDHRLPPWSGDYHFNINVEESLWPAFASGQHDALKPLFATVNRWRPILREQARLFVGVEDGVHLPHAVDDRGRGMGGFWTGAVDPVNAAWVGQLMWRYYRYTGEREFLADEAYHFLAASFRVFRRMMEDDGETLRLPLSVSPEYGAESDDAWGANASYALAGAHFLCEALKKCREILPGHSISGDELLFEDVADVCNRLPLFATGAVDDPDIEGEEIFLWEGQYLAHSHRHHSHLAAVYPFDQLDPADDRRGELMRNSYRRWAKMGMGAWSGWSLPWASILHGRLGSPEMAWLSLKIFEQIFTMPGYGTRHNSNGEGFTVLSGGDIMQLDGAIGYSAAVLELFVRDTRGRIELFGGIPESVPDCSFRNIRAEGGFELSGRREGGRNLWVQITSHRGEELRVASPWRDGCVVIEVKMSPRGGYVEPEDLDGDVLGVMDPPIITLRTEPGRSYLLVPK